MSIFDGFREFTYMVPKWFWVAFVVVIILGAVFYGVIGYVAVHFIQKFW
jgi:hypothetical protein